MAVGNCYSEEAIPYKVAVIFGVTGLVGKEIAKKLLLSKSRWRVYGIARNPEFLPIQNPNYHFISCDLLSPSQTQQKLSLLQNVTHIFWVTWATQFPLDSKECYEQNKEMMCNALNALLPNTDSLEHFSLQTGTKHYISLQGPFFEKDLCRYDENSPRAASDYNFYYGLEDVVKKRLGGDVAWSVHRPGMIMGSSCRTVYNVMGCLCVYASICKYMNLPFVFGGTKKCWEEMHIDGSDAGLVAEQHIWAATNENVKSSKGQAFNAINGPSFTWKEIWPKIGANFGIEATFSEDFLFSDAMGDKGSVWREIVKKEGLAYTEMNDLANWWFLDILFRCPVKMLASREKSDRLGFRVKCNTLESVMYWIDEMRREKLIP